MSKTLHLKTPSKHRSREDSAGHSTSEYQPLVRANDEVNMPQLITEEGREGKEETLEENIIDIPKLSAELRKLPFVRGLVIPESKPPEGGSYIRLKTHGGSDVRLAIFSADSPDAVKRRLNSLLEYYVNQQINRLRF